MIYILMPETQLAMTEISDFIDAVNTPGAGERWVERLIDTIESFAASAAHADYGLCKNEELAAKGFSCFNYNDWIMAFTVEEDSFIVHRIIRGSILL